MSATVTESGHAQCELCRILKTVRIEHSANKGNHRVQSFGRAGYINIAEGVAQLRWVLFGNVSVPKSRWGEDITKVDLRSARGQNCPT